MTRSLFSSTRLITAVIGSVFFSSALATAQPRDPINHALVTESKSELPWYQPIPRSVAYEVEHTWHLGLNSEWSFTPVIMGIAGKKNQLFNEVSIAEYRNFVFQVRAATIWSNFSAGSQESLSLLPIGVLLPPYSSDWIKPYYFLHWSQGIHELGIEIDKSEDFDVQLGLRGSIQYQASNGDMRFGVGFSHGIHTEWSESFIDVWDDDRSRLRFGLGGIGASYGTKGGGFRGSIFDLQIGYIQTSLVEGSGNETSWDYLSWAPIGVVFPPVRETIAFHYKFHWWPALQSKSLGMHSYGFGWHLDSNTWLIRASYTSGINNEGEAVSVVGIEVESLVLLLLPWAIE